MLSVFLSATAVSLPMSNAPDAGNLYSIEYLLFTLSLSGHPSAPISGRISRAGNAPLERAKFFETLGPLPYCEIIGRVVICFVRQITSGPRSGHIRFEQRRS